MASPINYSSIKLILTDLDGTLLHDDKTISDFSLQVLKEAQKSGILIGFSTSRAKIAIKEYIDQVKPDFLITNGGASVFVEDQVIYSCEFTPQETQTILNAVYKVCGENAEMTADHVDKIYWNRHVEEMSVKFADYSIYDDFKNFNQSAMKICVQTTDENKAAQIAASIGAGKIDYLKFSDIPWYKFSKSGATKEKAIEALIDYTHIPIEQTAAFGDDFNDIGMLKLVGTGVAMENAIKEVKECANETTCTNNEDGVAKWIKDKIFCSNH